MLQAFSDRLHQELSRPQVSMERYLRRFAGPDRVEEAKSDVETFLDRFPETINLLSEFIAAPDTALVVKLFYASVLAYLINPKDFLPEETYGLYGYLDDAYLVTSALSRTMGHIPRSIRQAHEPSLELLKSQNELSRKIATYLPPDVVDKLICALDSFENAAFLVCEQNTVGEVQTLLGSRFSRLSGEKLK